MVEYNPNYSPEVAVGRIWEVAINGVGYMLYDDRAEEQYQYQRATVPLQPPRFASTDTPFSEAVERYSFQAFTDWRGGRGQKRLSIVDANPAAFFESEGLDVFDTDGLKLLKNPVVEENLSAACNGLTVVDGALFYLEGTALKRIASVSASPSTVTTNAGSRSLCTDGESWYLANGTTTIRKGTTSSSTFKVYENPVGTVGWGANRVLAATEADTGAGYRRFTTFGDDGTEEIIDGRVDLPIGWNINSFTAGMGYVFFSAVKGNRSAIYAWDVTSYTPYVVDELEGEQVIDVQYFRGQVLIRAQRAYSGGTDLLIYRGVIDEGTGAITRFLVADITEEGPAVDVAASTPPAFCIDGALAYFAWGRYGVGAIDLESSGVAKWWETGSNRVVGPVMWLGRPTWAVDSGAIYRASDTAYVATGFIRHSVLDGSSTMDKIFDRIRIQSEVLPANTAVAVAHSVDTYATTVSSAGMAAGDSQLDDLITVGAKSMGLQLTLTSSNGVSTPVVQLVQLQMHAAGISDEVLVLPIDCGDHIRTLAGASSPMNGPGQGAARTRTLQALARSIVQVQDIDYADTGLTYEFEVEQVTPLKRSVLDRSQAEVGIRMVTVVQLRRSVTL